MESDNADFGVDGLTGEPIDELSDRSDLDFQNGFVDAITVEIHARVEQRAGRIIHRKHDVRFVTDDAWLAHSVQIEVLAFKAVD